jgi:hypothetical protein
MWARTAARIAAGPEEEARGTRPRPARAWLRMAGAAGGLTAVLAVGGLAADRVAGPAAPGGSAPPPAAPSTTPSAAAPVTPPTAPSGDGGAAGRPRHGHLRSEAVLGPGDNAYWAQSGVVLHSGEPLASLTVELRVALTGGVRHTGSWCTLPADDFEVSAREEGGALVYRWVLREGRTVPPGEHRFAGQYDHAEGLRDAGRDSYTARGTGPGGPVEVRGGFAGLPEQPHDQVSPRYLP